MTLAPNAVSDSALSSKLLTAAEAGDLSEVSSLLDHGADPAFQDAEGCTALMKAAEGGHLQVVTHLLQQGAPWNAQDNGGYCAGEYALGSRRAEVLDVLLEWGVQAELVLGAMQRQNADTSNADPCNSGYLQQKLHYEGEKLLDADGEAVMMGWERPLMLRHAEVISASGGNVLNVGFGLGIIDTALQAQNPVSHTIIEAHPDVHAHMLATGWGNKPNVRILFGRWQDVLPQLGKYDGVFFDTYGEYYEEMREFHKQLPNILKPSGIYSFFNGLAPDNIFFHMVYGRLVQLELSGLGISTVYQPLRMKELDAATWEGVKNKYWHFETYFLPICKYASDGPPASARKD